MTPTPTITVVDVDGHERSVARAEVDDAIAFVTVNGVRVPVARVVAVATPTGRRLESYDAAGRLLNSLVQVKPRA